MKEPLPYKPSDCIVTVLGTEMAFLTPSLFFSVARVAAILFCVSKRVRHCGRGHEKITKHDCNDKCA
jgi:hypothetical protein